MLRHFIISVSYCLLEMLFVFTMIVSHSAICLSKLIVNCIIDHSTILNTRPFYVNTQSFYLNNQLFNVGHSVILLNNQSFDVNTKSFYVKCQSFDAKTQLFYLNNQLFKRTYYIPCSVVSFPRPLPLGLPHSHLTTPFLSYCCALSHAAAL
jgi:hypothetical protein